MENTKQLNKEITACKDAFLKRKIVQDIDIALASYTVLDEHRHVAYPTPPKKVADYYSSPLATKVKMNKEAHAHLGFWKDPEVEKFFNVKEKIRNQNQRNKDWLMWMHKVLVEHPEKQTAIDIKLYQFTEEYTQSFGTEQPDWNQ